MFRDRTNLYLLYRRTVPRLEKDRFDTLDGEEQGLMGSRRRYRDNGNAIEMQAMIPSIFDIAKDLDHNLGVIRSEVNDLNLLYKRLIIASKSDRKQVESRVEDLNYQVLRDFEKCYVLIKKFEYLNTNWRKLGLDYTENDLEILNNFKKSYATQIQDSSLIFRNIQNNYIKFLRDDDDETDTLIGDTDSVLLEEEAGKSSQIENYSRQVLQQQLRLNPLLQEREREISNLAMGILEILTIFKEMELLVVDQGTLLDRIDYNLQNTVHDLKLSDKELTQARAYQKRTTKCKLIMLMSLVVFALFLIVLVKPHGKTVYKEVPLKDPNPPEQPDVSTGESLGEDGIL